MSLRSIRTRMFVVVFGLVAAVQLALLVAVHTANQRIAAESIERHLDSGERLFREVLRHREDQLLLAAQVLSADFAFRNVVGTGDLATAASVLENHAGRIGADSAILVAPDGRILADTLSRSDWGRPVDQVLQVTWDSSERSGIGWIGDDAHQLLTVPVRAPDTIAHLVMGFRVDDGLAQQLRQLTGLEVAFVATGGDAPRRIAGTAPDGEWNRLVGSETSSPRVSSERYEAIVTPMVSGGPGISALLMVERESILGPFRWLGSLLLGLAAVGLAVSAFGAIVVSRGITRPLTSMAEIAGRYARGDFDEVPEGTGDDELGVLARALAKMRDGLFERERKISRLAYYDPLTELANRTLLADRLGQSIALSRRQERPLTVVVLDLDRFKEVNGTLGHRRGDRILKEVGERLRRVVRDSDTIARLGGDEFALLLHSTDARGAAVLASKIQEILLEPVAIDGDRVDVSISMGGAVFPEHGDDPQSLLARADVAMYAAKATMSGFTMFEPSLDADHRGHLSLLGELRLALEREEIELWYQPKIDRVSGVVTAVEALVRWRHPERGLLGPGAFIEFAERSGFIKELTRYVLDAAIRQGAAWRRRGFDLKLSVNVSAKDLYDGALPDDVRACLARHRVDPGILVLEITETAMMVSPDNALRVLHRLRDDGVCMSIDDFGVGYSSLSHLRRLPVSELKIDRGFVSAMTTDREAAAIVRAAVDLGHTMGMRIVAEGVEDEATWHALSELGCDHGQGYWFSKPLPAPELEAWLETSRWSGDPAAQTAGVDPAPC